MKTFKQIREGVKDLKSYDDRNRKGFEAMAFIEIKKGNTSNKFDDDFGFSQAEMGVMDKVIGKIFMNSPIIPGQRPKGTKAATVVKVEMIIGKAISPIPFFAASILLMPSSSINL